MPFLITSVGWMQWCQTSWTWQITLAAPWASLLREGKPGLPVSGRDFWETWTRSQYLCTHLWARADRQVQSRGEKLVIALDNCSSASNMWVGGLRAVLAERPWWLQKPKQNSPERGLILVKKCTVYLKGRFYHKIIDYQIERDHKDHLCPTFLV